MNCSRGRRRRDITVVRCPPADPVDERGWPLVVYRSRAVLAIRSVPPEPIIVRLQRKRRQCSDPSRCSCDKSHHRLQDRHDAKRLHSRRPCLEENEHGREDERHDSNGVLDDALVLHVGDQLFGTR
jgi:hypothetical protein